MIDLIRLQSAISSVGLGEELLALGDLVMSNSFLRSLACYYRRYRLTRVEAEAAEVRGLKQPFVV